MAFNYYDYLNIPGNVIPRFPGDPSVSGGLGADEISPFGIFGGIPPGWLSQIFGGATNTGDPAFVEAVTQNAIDLGVVPEPNADDYLTNNPPQGDAVDYIGNDWLSSLPANIQDIIGTGDWQQIMNAAQSGATPPISDNVPDITVTTPTDWGIPDVSTPTDNSDLDIFTDDIGDIFNTVPDSTVDDDLGDIGLDVVVDDPTTWDTDNNAIPDVVYNDPIDDGGQTGSDGGQNGGGTVDDDPFPDITITPPTDWGIPDVTPPDQDSQPPDSTEPPPYIPPIFTPPNDGGQVIPDDPTEETDMQQPWPDINIGLDWPSLPGGDTSWNISDLIGAITNTSQGGNASVGNVAAQTGPVNATTGASTSQGGSADSVWEQIINTAMSDYAVDAQAYIASLLQEMGE